MLAFHNKLEVKQSVLAQVSEHERADEIINGTYWEKGKGCAVGCTIHGSDHGEYETKLGIPRILARLEDGIFENLPNELAKTWPRRFLEAIEPGADLSFVWPKFAVWILIDKTHGVLQFAKTDKAKKAITDVAGLYARTVSGEAIAKETWQDAAADAADAATTAAAAAAAYAAYAAAYAAYDAADAATTAAAAAAAYAAYAAAAAADAAYAARKSKREDWRIAQSEKLMALLQEAKPKA